MWPAAMTDAWLRLVVKATHYHSPKILKKELLFGPGMSKGKNECPYLLPSVKRPLDPRKARQAACRVPVVLHLIAMPSFPIGLPCKWDG